MVTPKYLQWSDFFTKVEPTVTVFESLRRLIYLREKIMNSVYLPFKFSLIRQKYSSNLFLLSCNISRAISDFLSLQKITGLPPLSIWSEMNSIKHYLKTFQESEVSKNDVYVDYITTKMSGCSRSTIANDLKDVVRFLEKNRTHGVFS